MAIVSIITGAVLTIKARGKSLGRGLNVYNPHNGIINEFNKFIEENADEPCCHLFSSDAAWVEIPQLH